MPTNIGFRDRSLNSYENSHYYCKKCGADVHIDLIHAHVCPDLKKRA